MKATSRSATKNINHTAKLGWLVMALAAAFALCAGVAGLGAVPAQPSSALAQAPDTDALDDGFVPAPAPDAVPAPIPVPPEVLVPETPAVDAPAPASSGAGPADVPDAAAPSGPDAAPNVSPDDPSAPDPSASSDVTDSTVNLDSRSTWSAAVTDRAIIGSSVDQCNSTGSVGGDTITCTVTITNNFAFNAATPDTPTGLATIVTEIMCTGSAICPTGGTTTSSTPVTVISQCNNTGLGGASTVTCTVTVTNNLTGFPIGAAIDSTVTQCQSPGGVTTLTCVATPPGNTRVGTAGPGAQSVTQCNASGGAGGTMTCTVTAPPSQDTGMPIRIEQCNASGPTGASTVTCTATITNNFIDSIAALPTGGTSGGPTSTPGDSTTSNPKSGGKNDKPGGKGNGKGNGGGGDSTGKNGGGSSTTGGGSTSTPGGGDTTDVGGPPGSGDTTQLVQSGDTSTKVNEKLPRTGLAVEILWALSMLMLTVGCITRIYIRP